MFESRSRWCVLDTTLCDKVCKWLAACRWISRSTGVSSTNKTDRHDIIEILLKVSLNNRITNTTKSARNHFYCVMLSVLLLVSVRSAVGLRQRLYNGEFTSSLLSTQRKGLRRKNGWFGIWINVSEWSNMSTCVLLFPLDNTIHIQLSVLV